LPFKCNLQRYTTGHSLISLIGNVERNNEIMERTFRALGGGCHSRPSSTDASYHTPYEGWLVTPGCQIGYMDILAVINWCVLTHILAVINWCFDAHTGCHQLVF
jgi:hypothetical protein